MGAGCGTLGGPAVGLLYYLYEQFTRPNPYNVLTLLLGAPVFAIPGALLGLPAAA